MSPKLSLCEEPRILWAHGFRPDPGLAGALTVALNGWRLEVGANEAHVRLIDLLRTGQCDLEHLSEWIRASVTR